MRFVFALALVAACSGAQPKPHGEPALAKKLSLSWGFTPVPDNKEMTDVFLATTDETARQISHPVGRYKGKCAAVKPDPSMKAIIGARCETSPGNGTELHAVSRPDEVVVLQMGLTAGAKPDPMAREPVTTIKVPLGITVDASP